MKSWINQLLPLITEYKDGKPLNMDSVDDLVHIIKAKINLHEGNITEVGYNNLLDCNGSERRRRENASKFLCTDEYPVEDQLKAIEEAADKGLEMLIDHIDCVQVTEQFEFNFTIQDFFDQIV